MYLVTIENNGIETVINEISTSTNNRISGTIKQGINTINSFTFTILPNNQGYSLINPITTLVKVLNTKTNKYEFIGRVLKPTYDMTSDGLISKTYVCESELGYLLDTQQLYEEVHNISVRDFLKKLIKVHNANTDKSKQFEVGEVTVVDSNNSLYRYISYDSTKKNIEEDLIDKLGGELQIRYKNGIRYLDYLVEVGKTCGTEIRLAKNLKDITQDIDFSDYANRIIPLGMKLKKKIGDDEWEDLEERLTVSSVNNGYVYIDDEESINKFGIIQKSVIFDEEEDADDLYSKGKRYLLNQRISISNKINALDLSLLDIDIDSFEVGNYYPLIHELLNINDVVRVIEKSISIDEPYLSTITLGDLGKDIKTYHLEVKKQANKTIQLQKEITTQSELISNVNVSINQTSQSLEKVSSEVSSLGSSTNETINKMIESVQLLSEAVTNINNNLTLVNQRLDNINISLTEANTKIIELDERLKTVEGGN